MLNGSLSCYHEAVIQGWSHYLEHASTFWAVLVSTKKYNMQPPVWHWNHSRHLKVFIIIYSTIKKN